jgi:hypothetical protein
LASYATTANFPSVGSSTVLYLAVDSSRAYQWDTSSGSGVYVEVGVSGGGSSGSAAADSFHPFLLMGG